MDNEALARLIHDHARFPDVLVNLVEGADAEYLRSRESEGRWSPLEILAHLRDEEIEDFRSRAQALADGQPIDNQIDPQGWVSERGYNSLDPGQVLRSFTEERAHSCAWLRSLRPEALDRSVEHPVLGEMRCGDFVAAWRMHDLLHLRQLATVLAILGARQLDGWRVDYAGRVPGA